MKNLLLLLFIATSFFAVAQTGAKTDAAPEAEITFEKTEHNFGTLPKGGNTTVKFYFQNTGKAPLVISRCQQSCGCTTPSCPTEAIMPGKKSFVEVHYDSLRVGQFSKTVTVMSNAKTADVVLKISGNITEEQSVPAVETPLLKPKE